MGAENPHLPHTPTHPVPREDKGMPGEVPPSRKVTPPTRPTRKMRWGECGLPFDERTIP
jgi:hypothetical protein